MPRGGSRPGAGRPRMYGEGRCADEQQAVSRTVTLTREQWAMLEEIGEQGSVSKAIRGLMYLAWHRPPNGDPIPGLRRVP